MTHIKGLGQNYVEEYKKFGEKILAENEQILKKAGITPTIFDEEQTNNRTIPLPTETSDDKTKDKVKKTTSKKTYEESALEENTTFNDVKATSGALNTIYKRILKKYNRTNSNDSKNNYQEYTYTLESTDGNDDNDDLADFLSKNYKEGLHINGGGFAYLEKGEISSVYSLNGNVAGSYKDKNGKLTLMYSGAVEYENEKSTEDGTEQSGSEKNGNALFLAKYKAEKLTYGGGGSANFYDNDTQQYNIYAGATHNTSGITLTLKRKIQVAKSPEGDSIIENQTDVKVSIIQPKDAGEFPNTVPDIPTPEKTKEADSLVESEKEEVKDIVTKNEKKGFGLDLILSTASNADEYGAIAKYATFYNKGDNLKMAAETYLGLSDYHPSTDEGLKVRIGAVGNIDYTTDNKMNISSTAIIDNKRIMQPGSGPQNTFMATLDTTVKNDKVAVTVSTGYINASSDIKHLFVTGTLGYKMKNSMVAVTAGYQDCDISSEKDKILYTGLKYAVKF